VLCRPYCPSQFTVGTMPKQVTGFLHYLSLKSTVTGRYVSPDGELRLGQYEVHEVPIHDARLERYLSLDANGFVLVPHVSRVSGFSDRRQVAEIYPAEVERLVRRLTNAHRVVTFGYGYRSAAAYRGKLNPLRCQVTTEPATDVHIDYTPQRANEVALRFLQHLGIRPDAVRRFVALNVWRPFTAPPQDWPLTVCDARTVTVGEGIPDPTLPVAVLPDLAAMPGTVPLTAPPGCGMTFHFNPQHRWNYFPYMTRDEVVVFVQYDSSRPGFWRTPHASFVDTSAGNVAPRESIEVRAIAYFF
jgi:hypothetical protein